MNCQGLVRIMGPIGLKKLLLQPPLILKKHYGGLWEQVVSLKNLQEYYNYMGVFEGMVNVAFQSVFCLKKY
jgi:hypothetical protein